MTNDFQQMFAVQVLKRLRAPVTPQNVKALVGWQHAEGGHTNGARFNPLNTTQPEPGAGNTGTQGNIKVYRSWSQGINATVQTLRNGRYGPILRALAHGNDAVAVADAIGQTPWGTSASLVRRVIGQTQVGKVPAVASLPSTSAAPRTTVSSSFDQQGFDQASVRAQILTQLLSHGNPNTHNPLVRFGLLEPDRADFTSTVRTSAPSALSASPAPSTADVPAAKGVAHFEGSTVAGWIAPILSYARKHGWKGKVSSGFRSFAEQKRIYDSGVRPAAVPGTSNHESSDYPRGAVDVTDAAGLSQILMRSPYASKLVWAGKKDPVHFSKPHGGHY